MAGKILIYDAIAANRIILRCKLSAACYHVAQAVSYNDLAVRCAADAADIVVLDLDEDADAALRFCRAARSNHDAVPSIIGVTASRNASVRRAALEAGAFEVLTKPVLDALLMSSLRHAFRERHAARAAVGADPDAQALSLLETTSPEDAFASVAVVAARNSGAWHWPAQLRALETSLVVQSVSFDQALAAGFADVAPDVYVLHAIADTAQPGLGMLAELRSRAAAQGARVVLVLGTPARTLAQRQSDMAMAYDLGADDVLIDGFDARELRHRVLRCVARKRRTDRINRSLKNGVRLATRDPLTGLYNRRYALPCLERMLQAARAGRQSLALLALDLDRFKAVNDTRGHAAGDAVLVDVARRLCEHLHPRDMIARSGGEEFWIAIADADETGARDTAMRLCRGIRDNAVALPGRAAPIRVTASIGVAVAQSSGRLETLDALLARADTALYRAKAGGRDMFSMADFAA